MVPTTPIGISAETSLASHVLSMGLSLVGSEPWVFVGLIEVEPRLVDIEPTNGFIDGTQDDHEGDSW